MKYILTHEDYPDFKVNIKAPNEEEFKEYYKLEGIPEHAYGKILSNRFFIAVATIEEMIKEKGSTAT